MEGVVWCFLEEVDTKEKGDKEINKREERDTYVNPKRNQMDAS